MESIFQYQANLCVSFKTFSTVMSIKKNETTNIRITDSWAEKHNARRNPWHSWHVKCEFSNPQNSTCIALFFYLNISKSCNNLYILTISRLVTCTKGLCMLSSQQGHMYV